MGTINETAVGPQPSYTLHARYARRRPRGSQTATTGHAVKSDAGTSLSDPTSAQDGRGEELDPETVRALLDFVSNEARAEREQRRQRIAQVWVALGVAIAATASVVAAIIQAVAA
jgi:hypothetical protein